MLNITEKNLLCQKEIFCTPPFISASGMITVEVIGCGEKAAAEIRFFDSQNNPHLFETHPAVKGHCAFTFDPVSLCIYRDAVSFELSLPGFDSVSRFLLTEKNVTDNAVSESLRLVFTDKNGDCLVPVLQADQKTVQNVSIFPKNVLFMGNSILLGMNLDAYGAQHAYGMCSSSPEHDYFHQVSQAILYRSPDCCFRRIYGSPFEHADTPEKFEAWWSTDPNPCSGAPAAESFTEDLDLIILQCGDNVNTDEKEARFAVQAPFLLEQIKMRCPNARILWVHSWYNYRRTCDKIRQLAQQWRFEEVDIHDLALSKYQASSGQTYQTPDGPAVVRDTWITHPGDIGMEKIARRILQQLSL